MKHYARIISGRKIDGPAGSARNFNQSLVTTRSLPTMLISSERHRPIRRARLVARIGNPMHLYAALVNKREDAPLFDNSAGFCAAIVAVAPAAIDLILSTSRGNARRRQESGGEQLQGECVVG
jgi:hypothetical protein